MGVADETFPHKTLRKNATWGSSSSAFLQGPPASESPGVLSEMQIPVPCP